MGRTPPARLAVAMFASLAMSVFVNARIACSQDAAADSTGGADASWESTGPTIDESAAAADKVLELPQATCAKDGSSGPCDDANADPSGDDSQAINAPSPGAPPQPSFDDDTASAAPNDDWGTVDEYQNQQVYAVPYGVPYVAYGYPMIVNGSVNRPGQVPVSGYAPSSPLTPAARPPLNTGPWMNPPTTSAFSRPAGSPMAPMMMSAPAFAFHR